MPTQCELIADIWFGTGSGIERKNTTISTQAKPNRATDTKKKWDFTRLIALHIDIPGKCSIDRAFRIYPNRHFFPVHKVSMALVDSILI